MLRYILFAVLLVPLVVVVFFRITGLNTDFNIPTILVFLSTIGLLKYSNYSKFRKLLVLYILVSCLNEVSSYYSALWYGTNGLIYNIYSWMQLIFIGFIFNQTLSSITVKRVLYPLVFIILTTDILNGAFGSFQDFPSLNLTLIGALILTLTLIQFNQMILKPDLTNLEKQPLFWFSIGNLIFYSITFFTFGFLSSTKDIPEWLYLVVEGANIVLYTTYFVAIILDSKPKSYQNDSIR